MGGQVADGGNQYVGLGFRIAVEQLVLAQGRLQTLDGVEVSIFPQQEFAQLCQQSGRVAVAAGTRSIGIDTVRAKAKKLYLSGEIEPFELAA